MARVRRPVGLDGSFAVTAYSDDPQSLAPGARVMISGREERVVSSRPGAKGATVIRLQSISSPEEADRLRGLEIEVLVTDLPETPPGVYYHYQIIGAAVRTVQGHPVGRVTEILQTGGNDVYVVKPPSGREVLVPAIADIVIDVDADAGLITIDPPKGLLD